MTPGCGTCRSDWKEGISIEAFCDGDWWKARIIQVDCDRVKVHYEGGDDEEDEWMTRDSGRLRPSQKLPKSKTSRVSDPDKGSDEAITESNKTVIGEQRPLRRSRIMSDDARLAMQLQEQEVKAAREMKAFSRKRTASTPRLRPTKPKLAEGSPPPAPGKAEMKAVEVIKKLESAGSTEAGSEQQSCRRRSAPVLNVRKKPFADSGTVTGVRRTPASRKPKQGSHAALAKEDVEGMVSFSLAPDDTLSGVVPDLKRNTMSLAEDTTVFHIKRRIIDEVLSDHVAGDIEIRTTSGILLGQDHSLRYVRTILWPRCKGDLILRYGLKKSSLL